MLKRVVLFWACALVITMVAAAGLDTAYAARKLVKVDGSSTVFPITEAVAEEFQIENRGRVMVTVGVSGTGGGFKKFCRGETDLTNASRPIKASEKKLCESNGIEFIELPVAFDGLAVMVNNANDWVDYLTIDELKIIWEPAAKGKIKSWSQVRKGWPDTELALFGPGTDSGTFDYFTKAINGKEGASRSDFTASEDDNVLVQGISTSRGALGYFGLAYYEYNKNKLKLIAIDDKRDENGKGAILPSIETVADGTYQPLSRPLFLYVSKPSAEKAEVSAFVKFYMENADWLTEEVGYVPLPSGIYEKALDKFFARRTGSVFGSEGSELNVSIEDLVKKD